MKYRVRIVFNAPVDRTHPFTSVAKDTLEDAQQIIEDMQFAIIHAVSVTIQQQTLIGGGWDTMSTLEPGKLRP